METGQIHVFVSNSCYFCQEVKKLVKENKLENQFIFYENIKLETPLENNFQLQVPFFFQIINNKKVLLNKVRVMELLNLKKP